MLIVPGHNFDDVAIGSFLGLSIASLTFQFHVNWWWMSLHGGAGMAESALLADSPTDEFARHGMSITLNSDQRARRDSGPSTSVEPTAVVMLSPTGRRSIGQREKSEEAMDAPLLGTV